MHIRAQLSGAKRQVESAMLILIAGIPFLIPMLMPSLRALAVLTVLIGVALAGIWANVWIIEQNPPNGPGYGIGLGILFFINVGFAAGAGIRAIWLIWREPAWSPRVTFLVNALSILAALFLFLLFLLF
jgi:hypothetical protein